MNIKKDPDKQGNFLVESSHQKGKYYSVDPKKPFCSCEAFIYRYMKMHGECKHITAVKESLQKDAPDTSHALAYVKEHLEVDAVKLIEQFGEETVEELKRKGEIIEKKGIIRLLD